MEETECSETSAHKLHTPGNYTKDSIKHKETRLELEIKKLCISSQIVAFEIIILYNY